jgi:hypothetical protein
MDFANAIRLVFPFGRETALAGRFCLPYNKMTGLPFLLTGRDS